MSQVSIRRLVKNYGPAKAILGIDLEIGQGELVVLLGPSGCGKTTTLRCVAGLEEVSDGEIHIGGKLVSSRDHSTPTERRQVGMVFQSYAIWPHMSVRQNVAFGLQMKHLGRAAIEARVAAALDMVGLGGYAGRGASQLSGGQQQRVALARAVVLEPQILLFDEPLSNLDARLRERMRFELRELQKRIGITAIYVTHDQQEAMAMADRVVLMRDGRIEQIGSPEDMYNRPASLFAAEFVGVTNAFIAEVAERSGGTVRLRLSDSVAFAAACDAPPDASPVQIVIRPEHVALSAQPLSGDNSFAATVKDVAFLGNLAELHIQLGTLVLRVQQSPPGKLRPGQAVWGRIDPADIVMLPATVT
jgi:ABC-type Fe3+/spermidine/putrescine transport system ATPase subunit